MNMQSFIGRSETRKLGAASFGSVMVRTLGTAATFAYTLLMSRTMTPSDVGIVWSIWSASFIATTFVTLNIGAAAVRDVVAARVQGRDDLAAGFIVASRALLVVTAPVVCLVFLGGVFLRDPSTVEGHATGFIMATLAIPVLGWIQTNASHAAALHRALLSQVPRMLIRPLLFLVAFLIIWSTSYQPSVDLVLTLFFVSVCLAALVQFLLLRSSFAFMKGVKPDTSLWRDWVLSGLGLAPMLLLTEHLKHVAILFCGLALQPAEIGTVAIALSIVTFLSFGVTAVDAQFSPRISAALVREDLQRVRRLQAFSNLLKFVPTVVVALALLLFMERILGLFGAHYVEGAAACAWFMAMPVARAVFGNATLVLQIRGHRADILWSTIAALGLMAVGSYAGGALYGTTGAAAGCSLAYCILMGTRYLSCRMRTGIDTSIFSSPSALVGSRRSR